MEKNGNWSVITRNCPELVRKFYLFNKTFKKMKNRESGKFPGNGREMPGNFLDFGTTEKLQKIPKNLESWVYYFPVSRFFCSNFPDEISRFPGVSVLISRMKFPGFPDLAKHFSISRFPGFPDLKFPKHFPRISRVHDLP